MTATPGRTRCVTCGKEKATLKCGGCLQDFCYNHSTEHRNELSKQLDEVETTRDIFRQILTEQTTKPQKHALMQQIDKWECDSIMKIRQTADEAREMLLKHTTGHIAQIETKLNRLTDQLRQSREENDFFETDLHQWKKDLTLLTEQLINPSDITMRQGSTPLVTKMYIDVAFDMPGTCKFFEIRSYFDLSHSFHLVQCITYITSKSVLKLSFILSQCNGNLSLHRDSNHWQRICISF